jgi:hypothetical protein
MLHLLKNRDKTYIISVISGLAVLFLILFFIWLLLTGIKNNSKNLISIKNNTAVLETQNNEIEDFKKNYWDYKPNLDKINQLFVDPKNPVDFIKFLEEESYNSGINPKIALLPISQQENQNIITFQLFSNGDFSKIMDFSEKLEAGPYLIEIKSLTIKNSDEEGISKNYASGKVDAVFVIKTFIKQ